MLKKLKVEFLFLIIIGLFSIVSINAQSSKAKSMANEIRSEFPYRQQQIAEKCDNASVIIDVDFNSFGDNTDALLRVPQLGLKETANAFRRFCTNSNDTSKFDPAKVDALKSKVKKIILKHVESAEAKNVSLQSGEIVLIEMKFDDPSKGGINYVAMADRLAEIL